MAHPLFLSVEREAQIRHTRGMAGPHAEARDTLQWRSPLEVFGYTRLALQLVWQTSRRLTVALVTLTVAGGLLPAAAAWVGKQIVDAVVASVAAGPVGGMMPSPKMSSVASFVSPPAASSASSACPRSQLSISAS